MRSNIYLVFAFIAGIAVVGIAVFTAVIAAIHTVSPSDFPAYAYSEYIDRTENVIFTADGGAQLYESEGAEYGNSLSVNNAIASGGVAIKLEKGGDGIDFSITSDSVMSARLFLSICYTSISGSDIAAERLLEARCNGVEASVRTATVQSCGSPYDFRNNELCTVELRSGRNEIKIVPLGEFTLDYLLLVSVRERTSNDPVIGHPVYSFDIDGGMQKLEAEQAEINNAVVYGESSASGNFYLRLFKDGAGVTFYPRSAESCTVSLYIALRSTGSSARVSDLCKLYVNGMSIVLYPVGTGVSDKFITLYAADIALGEGVNELRFAKKSGVFDIDYIELNNKDVAPPEGGVMI